MSLNPPIKFIEIIGIYLKWKVVLKGGSGTGEWPERSSSRGTGGTGDISIAGTSICSPKNASMHDLSSREFRYSKKLSYQHNEIKSLNLFALQWSKAFAISR